LIRALDETNTSFELNLQWPLKALTMTISNMVVMDALHNVIEVREEVDPFNTTLRLLLYLLMQHNNSPQLYVTSVESLGTELLAVLPKVLPVVHSALVWHHQHVGMLPQAKRGIAILVVQATVPEAHQVTQWYVWPEPYTTNGL